MTTPTALTSADLDAFANQLPATVRDEVTRGDRTPNFGAAPFGLPSYFDVNLTLGGPLNGRYDAWCIRTDQSLFVAGSAPGVTGTFTSQVYSSYETIPASVLQNPSLQPQIPFPTAPDPYINKLQQLNWLFNNVTEAANVTGGVYVYGGTSYTLGDVQLAIWKILGQPVDAGDRSTLGAYDITDANANALVALAQANGDSFIPEIGADIGVILEPTNGSQVHVIEVRTAGLGDYVWFDADKDGVQDADEAGVANVTISLFNAAGTTLLRTTTTDASGYYQFGPLLAGDYKVKFDLPAGFVFTQSFALAGTTATDSNAGSDGFSEIITLNAGDFNRTIDAGLTKKEDAPPDDASLGDRLWLDANANGLQDNGEVGIANRIVTLIGGGADGLIATTGDNTIATTTTDTDGLYSFIGLTPGVQYQVQFGDKPAGSVFTTPNVNSNGSDTTDSDADTTTGKTQIVTLAQGENNPTLDAGVFELATLSGYVYQDLGNDGIRDTTTPIAGVLLTLTGTDGAGNAVTATATTDANGFYQFINLVPGTYTVSETQPSAFLDGKDTPGSTGGSNVLNDILSSIVLTSGDNSVENNFGELLPARLGDRLWLDANANGLQDNGEVGIANRTVTLIGGGADGVIGTGSDDTTATTTTGANGFYEFTGLTPGVEYQVQFGDKPAGSVFSAPNVSSNGFDTTDSDADTTTGKTQIVTLAQGENNPTLDAGVFELARLGDRVWFDTNNNGRQDSGETGAIGVTVTLFGGGADGLLSTTADNTTASTTTDANGNYAFTGLTPGVEYQVGFSNLPTNFLFTSANQGADDAIDSDADTVTGRTQIVTLTSGENNPTLDAGLIRTTGDLKITKTDGLTWVCAGQQVTYTIVVSNNGTATATNAQVSDLIPANLTNVTWTSVAAGGASDNQLSGTGNINDFVTLPPGGSITYTLTGTVVGSTTLGSLTTFNLVGNSALDGTDGNTRTFTSNGITVTASAFSRVDGTNGAWSQAFLGSFGSGLGVTDSGEGNGGGDTHVVDNVGGRDNYIVFRFSESVVLDRALLQYVRGDSDISVWIGNTNSPVTSLSDAFLSGLGFNEVNDTTLTGDRWANVNAGLVAGNTVVIAASTADTTPDDGFKLRSLEVNKLVPGSGTLTNTATVTGPNGFIDNDLSNNSATDTSTICPPQGDLSITKTDGLTTVFAGQRVTYTIVVSNTGPVAANGAQVRDLIPANLTNVTWTSVASGGATGNAASGTGNINEVVNLASGSSITYTLTGTVVGASTLGSKTCFDLDGNSALDGPDGNVRTFTANGITLTARAFSRVDGTNGAWSQAWLGSYSGGLGVTDTGEGSGSSTHRVDNIGGRDNYVVFQFSESVVLDRAYLQSVICDSDISLWIGNSSGPITSMSDSFLSGLGFNEVNDTTSSSDRWADVNAGRFAGNTVVISASAVDLTPEDEFKIRYLEVNKLASSSSSLVNTATVTAPGGFTDTNSGNNAATDTDTIMAAPGVRTPGFWSNATWRQFWDGNPTNQNSLPQNGTANFPTGDLLRAPYVNSSQPGTVIDPVTGVAATTAGLLVGDFNRNGITDSGEDTLFYSTSEALRILDPSQNPDTSDVRYSLARNVVAAWLNHLAGNPVDTAATNDKDARYYLNEGIHWLQALTPDEGTDRKGDGSLSGLNAGVTSNRILASSTFWNGPGITSAAGLPSPYNGNTAVAYGIEPGSVISTALDNYNNGRSGADGLFYGGA